MKQFDILTEADARVLDRGETVTLSRRGHITPLAQDTLKERRITVVREGAALPEHVALVPPADIRRVAAASDHNGLALRRDLIAFLRSRGLLVLDLGTDRSDRVDYPDIAASVADAVVHGEADAGVVIDSFGVGSAIAANKVPGIRAAMATSEAVARHAREHIGANVLTLGARLVTPDDARGILVAWLEASMREPRSIGRLAKIRDLERRR